jgi:hypothetical protein
MSSPRFSIRPAKCAPNREQLLLGKQLHRGVSRKPLVGLPQIPPMGRLPRITPQRDFVRRGLRDRRYSLRCRVGRWRGPGFE